MKNEEWRDVAGYEGLYQVSSEGRVKSLKRKDRFGRTIRERILKLRINRDGYLKLNLHAGGKTITFLVHRLVCQAFHENPDNKPQVNHINEIKTDNRACNLEWSTAKENTNHGSRNERIAKSREKPIGQYKLDGQLIKVWPSTTEVGRQTEFDNEYIGQAARGKYKQAYGFIWKYV